MKTLGILLALSTLAAATIKWNDLRVRWGYNSKDPSHAKIFFQIPRILQNAVSAGWVEVTGVSNAKVTTYCLSKDPRFCILFDSYGFIAGVQVGILATDIEDVQSMYDMSRIDQFQLKTMFGVKVWTSTVYTQDPDAIAAGGQSSTWNDITGTGGVWFEITNGYLKVPRDLKDLDTTIWVKEGCTPTMGTHYFYNMHDTTACENFEPWFLLYHEGTLNGVGFQAYGKRTSADRVWYENITTDEVRYTIANGPQCLYDWCDAYGGVISMHMFFTADPWTYKCS